MVSKSAAILALASLVAGQCAQNVFTTNGGLSFYVNDANVASLNNRPLQLRKSKTGDFSYVALDSSSPVLTANIEDGTLFSVDSHLAPTGPTAYLQDYTVDLTFNPPTVVGKWAFANSASVANASDPNWRLYPITSPNIYNLWRVEPDNTLNGYQLCQADFDTENGPWWYFQYVDWVGAFPQNCQFVGVHTKLVTSDMPTC